MAWTVHVCRPTRLLRAIVFIVPLIADRAEARGEREQAVLQKHISLPAEALTPVSPEGTAHSSPAGYDFGGDLRIGDLDIDGTPEFVVAKAMAGHKLCHLAAFTWNGELLWQWGNRHRAVRDRDDPGIRYAPRPPARPGPVLVIDIDGDNATEVIAIVLNDDARTTTPWRMDDTRFIILDGTTGRIERESAPRELLSASAYNRSGEKHEPNYVHQRLLAANFRGLDQPQDMVIKIGNTVLALDHNLTVLWSHRNRFAKYGRHASYIPAAGDLDGDGRDDLLGGNFALDHRGVATWEKMMARHNDSVAVIDWDHDASNGTEAVLSGFGQVVDTQGEPLIRLGPEVVPHGQEVRVGTFASDRPSPQMAIRYDGHKPDILYADQKGRVFQRFKVDPTPLNVGLETLWWHGKDQPALLYSPAALWDGQGRLALRFPNLPPASERDRMAWYHCIPVDLDGSGRESAVLFDPCRDEIFIYGSRPLASDPPSGYRHTSRQYNVRLMD